MHECRGTENMLITNLNGTNWKAVVDRKIEIRRIELNNLLNFTVDAAGSPVYNNVNSGNTHQRIETRMGIIKM